MDASRYISLTRRWWWLLATGVLVAIAAYGVASTIRARSPETPRYAAEATLFVSLRPFAEQPDTSVVDRPWDMDRLLASYAALLRGESVAERASRNWINVPAADVRAMVAADTRRGTHMIDVRVTADQPALSDAVLAGVLTSFDALRREQRLPGDAIVTEMSQARAVADAQTPEWLTILIVVAAGLAAGFAVIVAFEYISDSVRDARDAEHEAAAPVLASIPMFDAMCSFADMPSGVVERYRMLRTNARLQSHGDAAAIVAITAPNRDAGATTTAINYATSLAHAGQRVVLIDANVDAPALSRRFDVATARGLTDALAADLPVYGLVHATEVDGLSVTPAGMASNAADLFESPRLAALLHDLRERFDAIVVNAPPVLENAAPLSIAALADAAILTLRCDVATRADTAVAAEALRRSAPRLLGVVLNADASIPSGAGFTLPFLRRRASHAAEARA